MKAKTPHNPSCMRGITALRSFSMVLALMSAVFAKGATVDYWTADGQQHSLTGGEPTLTVPAEAVALDLRGAEAAGIVALDLSLANPNCLYYADGCDAVEGLPDHNVVVDGLAEAVLLTDEADFLCPIGFTATDIILHSTPHYDLPDDLPDSPDGYDWPHDDLLVLPFDMDEVFLYDANSSPHDATGYEWFTACTFYGCYLGIPTFFNTPDNKVKAYTPTYVKYAAGSGIGTSVQYYGHDKYVAATPPVICSGEKGFELTAYTTAQSCMPGFYYFHCIPSDCFKLWKESELLRPFRCVLGGPSLVNMGSEETNSLTLSCYFLADYPSDDTGPTSIADGCRLAAGGCSSQVFTLGGLRAGRSAKGIGVRQGRKVVVR